jgi:hypothetical protein
MNIINNNINYISIGTNDQITGILQSLGLRKSPLPFDWTCTNLNSIKSCFENNFKKYHSNLKPIHNDSEYESQETTHVIDEYGFIFKKEVVPLITNSVVTTNQQLLIDSIIDNKYKKRIEYFTQIMNDYTTPIICLCNYPINDVIELQKLFIQYYNRTNNLYIINISLNTSLLQNPELFLQNIQYLYQVNINTMNIHVWKYMIDLVLRHIKNNNNLQVSTTPNIIR